MTTLQKPKNNTAKILREIILWDGVNEQGFHLNGFRARISNIRKALAKEGIRLRAVEKEFTNEFGRAGRYKHHFLTNTDKRKAQRIYKEINNRS